VIQDGINFTGGFSSNAVGCGEVIDVHGGHTFAGYRILEALVVM